MKNMRLHLGNPLTFTASYLLLSLSLLLLLLLPLPSSFIIFIVAVIYIAISISCYSIIFHISFWWLPSRSQCRTWGCHCLSKSTIVCSFHQNLILTMLIISTNLSVFNKATPMIINSQGSMIREDINRKKNIFISDIACNGRGVDTCQYFVALFHQEQVPKICQFLLKPSHAICSENSL